MSLSCRIIPCLDVDHGRVVKGRQFVNLVDAGNPTALALYYDQQGADELVFLDISASHENRRPIFSVIEEVANQVFLPLTVGGGINTVDCIHKMLAHGADKVSLNSAVLRDPTLIDKAARKFGCQCIVVAIDSKCQPGGSHQVYSHGGRVNTDRETIAWAKEVADRGAGEILLTSMDRDGTKQGYDCALLTSITQAVDIPVIVSGGAGKLPDFLDAWNAGSEALLAASLFHFKSTSIAELKSFLASHDVPIRPVESNNLRTDIGLCCETQSPSVR